MNRPDAPAPRLKAVVRAHRDAFDGEAPPASVWDALESTLDAASAPPASAPTHVYPRARILTLYPYWRKAAVACMLLTIGVLSGLLLADRLDTGTSPLATSRDTPLRELEASYQGLLAERIAEVQRLGPDSALNAELAAFSAPDSGLSAELSRLGGANEHLVLEAMAQEYQAKLDALQRVLVRLRAAETRTRHSTDPDRRRL